MQEDLQKSIIERLEHASSLIDVSGIPHDYPTLKHRILQYELRNEVGTLKNLIQEDPDGFIEKFKERCALRERSSLGIGALPQSATNTLYWDIVYLLYKNEYPNDKLSMKGMLEILMPGTKKQWVLNYSVHHESTKRKLSKASIQFAFEEQDLQGLTEEAEQKALSHYVFSEEKILDTRLISQYDLLGHQGIQDALTEVDPNLSDKLYRHNSHFEVLGWDLEMLNQDGLSFKEAVEKYTKACILGGERKTGKNYATSQVERATKRFIVYFTF